MKYYNKEVIAMYEGLAIVYKSGIAFPAKTSYAIVRNLKILAPIYEDIMKTKEALICNNGIREEDCYKIFPEKREFVSKELQSLGEAENELSLTMIKVKDLEGLNLSVNTMEGLYFMIEDEG